ncbi:DUF484 family protein [Sinimarinibacterium sp. NLF-5-8]|uniref:DUF484 family protein n=1 Tax=Sinimarinibacterium sp. NLF-5-8 TaxID=2698684 RepID=UPI00137C0580|nr:DUF484 family protein [Sinimarinibacterium sp. NLF-5-8]QHS08817.1 DUF484 family protein [Sinimarinibacterium sp. NLF-5-8]
MVENTAQKESGQTHRLNEREIVTYLKAHPDFLLRHPDLLETIELRHKTGSAISLIEKQVDILRVKNQRLDDRMQRMLSAARDNETRTQNVHRLARTLIRAPSMAAAMAGLGKCLREDFGIDEVFVGVSGAQFKRHDIEGIVPIESDGRLARAYENFFRTRLIECGPLGEAQARLLFPKASQPVLCAAVVPLEKEKSLGMLALGSYDAKRFTPGQGKLFLELTADLVSAAVRARL